MKNPARVKFLTFSMSGYYFNKINGGGGPGRVSKCHGHTVVRPRKILLSLRKLFRCVHPNKKSKAFFAFNMFWHFFKNIFYVTFRVFFADFLAQIFVK